MLIEYKIDENVFLTYQLFVASKTESIKKKRRKSKIIIPILCFIAALLFLFEEKYLLTSIFSTTAFIWFFIYPIWEKGYYANHYKSFIKENYQGKINRNSTLELNNKFLIAKDTVSESKTLTTELEEINEIPTAIFIKLKSGSSFVLPKDKIHNIEIVKKQLQDLANHLNIQYIIDDQWKWK